ncbi:MAG: hypothetical protein OHK0019_16890 [Saprospiraceae bacterium]
MNDNLFDKKLKAALDNVEVPYEPATWAALEQRLNAPFTEEHPAPVDAVDKAVFRTLERLEAPYQPAHWEVLANRMTQAVRLRRRIWATKLSEAAIFLLLLANLDGFFGDGTFSPQEQPPSPQQLPKNNRLQAEAPASRWHKSGNFVTGSLTKNSFSNGLEQSANAVLAGWQTAESYSSEEFATLQESGQFVFDAQNISGFWQENWPSLADLLALPVLSGQPVVERMNANPYAVSKNLVKTPKQSRMYAASFANFDKNFARSEGYSNTANGYGGGVAIGTRIGKWGVEAGISYNRRRYQPKKEIEIYDITTNGLHGSYASNVDADLLSVPVKITRQIAQFGQASIHATAGVTTNIALDKSYQYAGVFYPAPSSSGDPSTDQKPKLRKNGQGALENGSLAGNVYASADLGLRIEHPIGRRLAAFVEPAYRQSLGGRGIGPNPARINTFSVQAGVLATL